jgi:hypothetical protein
VSRLLQRWQQVNPFVSRNLRHSLSLHLSRRNLRCSLFRIIKTKVHTHLTESFSLRRQVTPVTQSYPGTSVRPSTTAVSADAFISAQRQYATPVSVQPPFVPKSRPQSASSRTARTSGGQNVLSRSYVSGKSVVSPLLAWVGATCVRNRCC